MRHAAVALTLAAALLAAPAGLSAPSGGPEAYRPCLLRAFPDGPGWRPTGREGVFAAPGDGGSTYVRVPNLERGEGPALWVENRGFSCLGGGAGFTVFEGPAAKALVLLDVRSGDRATLLFKPPSPKESL